MKNSADQGGCYPQRPKAEVDNTLRDLQNSSYPTKAEFNNCFIIHSKYLLVLKGVSPFCSLFFRSPNITQRFNNLRRAAPLTSFWRHWFNNFRWAPLLTSLIQYGEDSFQIWWTAASSNWLCWLMRVVLTNQKREIFWMNNKEISATNPLHLPPTIAMKRAPSTEEFVKAKLSRFQPPKETD